MMHRILAMIGVVLLPIMGCSSEGTEIRESDTYQTMLWNWNDFPATRQDWLCDKFEHDRHSLVSNFDAEGIPPEVTELFFTDVC